MSNLNRTLDKEEHVKRSKSEVDDYLQSVIGLYAFAHSCAWNNSARRVRPDSKICIPRKMASASGSRRTQLTPDGVVQVDGQYGVVSEMKKHFQLANGRDTFDQIRRYSAPLWGWWTKTKLIDHHDVALLTHITSSTDASDAFDEWSAAGNEMESPFAIVEFGYVEQGQLWFMLRRIKGGLSDKPHDESLRRGKKLSPLVMTDVFSRRKFMENEPPLIYMLLLVYVYALPLFGKQETFEESTGGKVVIVKATAAQVRDRLEEQFCPRGNDAGAFNLPRLAWVKRALETLVQLDLGTRPSKSTGAYRIVLRQPGKKDLTEYFAERLYAHGKTARQKPTSIQPDLFE